MRHQCIEQITPANIEPVRLNKRIAVNVSRSSMVSPQLLAIDWTSQLLPCFALARKLAPDRLIEANDRGLAHVERIYRGQICSSTLTAIGSGRSLLSE